MADKDEHHGGGGGGEGHDDHGEKHAKHGGHGGGHGGGHEEHEEGVPEWVVSFADNALLQMGFFCILLAMNMGLKARGPVDPNDPENGQPAASSPASDQWLDAVLAIRESFNSPVNLEGTNPNEASLRKRAKEKLGMTPMPGSQGQGAGEEDQSNAQKDAQLIGENETVVFETSSSMLSRRAKDDIEAFVKAVKGQRFVIEVRGHVSPWEARGSVGAGPNAIAPGGPDGTTDIKRGHRLAFDRALAVTEALVAAGIEPQLIRVKSSSDGERVSQTVYTDAQKRSNQRVEIIKTNEQMPADPYSQDPNEREK